MGCQTRFANSARYCTVEYPRRAESEVGYLAESSGGRDGRYDASQTASPKSQEGKLAVRLPEKLPVFSCCERAVLYTVSVLLCIVPVLLTARLTVSHAERDFMQQA